VDADGPVEYQTSMTRDPDELIVDIPNAVLAQEFGDIPVGHEILQGIRVEQPSEKAVRLTMDLVRIVGFDVTQDESQNRLTIALQMPKGAGGPLSGRTVVIDPGHGGHATGATGLDGRFEKESNLAISKRVRKLLLDAGVCAILTRTTDKSLDADQKSDLAKRAEFAARHSADIFLSIHSNSIAGPKCPSGLETYYHGRDMSGRALAYCVHSEVTRAGLLPDLRVRSDFMLYQTGLGVLRNAVERFGIPAALIEVGYVKHTEDLAKIRNPKFQEKVAEAMVRGLRLYFEGNPPARPEKSEPGTQEVSKPARTEKPSVEPAVSPKPAETKKPSTSKGPTRPGVR
jgi:N-acetylmuramoyl-L-alanine amidase